jgi:hypothetical protein
MPQQDSRRMPMIDSLTSPFNHDILPPYPGGWPLKAEHQNPEGKTLAYYS